MHRIGLSIAALWLLSSAAATAAEIDVRPIDNKSVLIIIEGDFEHDDVEAFRAKVAGLTTPRATVAFRSDGGSLVAGIRIGTLIREKKFATVIPDGASCASACALAWLGGTKRFMGQGASVGFHAAYILRAYGPVESGSGNAILGAYLNQLGLSEDAILYITKTAPTSIQWMNLRDANEHGITVAMLSPQQAVPPSSGVAIAEQRAESPERRATDFVRSLLAHWSKPSAEALPLIEGLYAETVVFQGRSTPKQEVLSSKRRVAERFNERSYTIQPGTLSATCARTGATCRVKGVMSWKLYDAKTSNRIRGTSTIEYRVALVGEAPQIVAEARSVQERPSTVATRLDRARRDLQQLLGKVSKLVQ
jgi:hypothetical protein